MILRTLFLTLAALLCLALGWRALQTDAFKTWWNPPPPPKAFQFDNGSVRAAPVAASGPAMALNPGLKKCRQGERVVYTDGPCPAGSKFEAMGGTVNVVNMPKAPASTARERASDKGNPGEINPSGRLPNVRDLLHDPGPTLREQHTERVINAVR
jgi:hypothetical protein